VIAPSSAVLVNPPASVLGAGNAILSGTNRRYLVHDFEGCLSVKTVVRGAAAWETGGRRFVVRETSYLIVNDRERYSMAIESARPVTTFCVFFRRGFVEDVARSLATPVAGLLDAPEPGSAGPLEFPVRLETHDGGRVLPLVRELRARLLAGCATAGELEDRLVGVAAAMAAERNGHVALEARLPATRDGTRRELHRRLLRGRDFMLSSLDRPVRLADAARAACLSPHHFHRAFVAAFGETPHRFVTRHRLERARTLLGAGGLSVTEISAECGFESPGSFSALFHRAFGLAPREFRSQRRPRIGELAN
jgi:AraC family transcriptional regulator